jgi:hypothetical protein
MAESVRAWDADPAVPGSNPGGGRPVFGEGKWFRM